MSDVGSNPLLVSKLLNAVIFDDLVSLRAFLSLCGSPNVCDVKGNTPLILAAEGDLPHITMELIAAGADVNRRDAQGMTALMHALRWNDKASETVRILLEAGAEYERPDSRGYYLNEYVMMAALWGWEVPTELVLNPSHLDITRAAKEGDKHLLAQALRRDVPRRILTNALIFATSEGNEECCRLLLSKGADVNGFDIYGARPLSAAAVYLHVEVAQLLLARGAEVNGRGDLERTPLIEACMAVPEGKEPGEIEKDRYAMVDLLIREGADVNCVDDSGYSACHVADDPVVILLLLKNGAGSSGALHEPSC